MSLDCGRKPVYKERTHAGALLLWGSTNHCSAVPPSYMSRSKSICYSSVLIKRIHTQALAHLEKAEMSLKHCCFHAWTHTHVHTCTHTDTWSCTAWQQLLMEIIICLECKQSSSQIFHERPCVRKLAQYDKSIVLSKSSGRKQQREMIYCESHH